MAIASVAYPLGTPRQPVPKFRDHPSQKSVNFWTQRITWESLDESDRFQQVIHGLLIRRYLSAVAPRLKPLARKIDGQFGAAGSFSRSVTDTNRSARSRPSMLPKTPIFNQPRQLLDWRDVPKSPGGGASGSTLGRGTGLETKLPSLGLRARSSCLTPGKFAGVPMFEALPADPLEDHDFSLLTPK